MSSSKCATGCGFYPLPGLIYCSKHFNELATPQEKAERQRALDEEKNKVESAQQTFQAILNGPIESAAEGWRRFLAMPGFRVTWVPDEISACSLKGREGFQKILRLEEGQDREGETIFQYKGLRPLMAYLKGILEFGSDFDHNRRRITVSATDPLLDNILDHPSLAAISDEDREGKIPFEVINTVLYRYNGNLMEMVERLLPYVKIDKQLLDAAKFTCKRPANVPTPEKLAVVKLIEGTFKERKVRGRAEADENTTKRQRSSFDFTQDCCFLRNFTVDGTSCNWAVWSCGAYPLTCTHVTADTSSALASASASAVSDTPDSNVVDHRGHTSEKASLCAEVAATVSDWQPAGSAQSVDYPTLCFPISRSSLIQNFGLTVDFLESASSASIISAIVGLPLPTKGRRKNTEQLSLVTKDYSSNDAIFFHKRWYSGYESDEDDHAEDGDDEEVRGADAEVAGQMTTTTKAFKTLLADGEGATQVTLYSSVGDMYSPQIFLVGHAKSSGESLSASRKEAAVEETTRAEEHKSTRASKKAATGPKGKAKKTSLRGPSDGIVVLVYADNNQTHIEMGSHR